MSNKLVGDVMEHYPAQGGELLLAIALADGADHEGGSIEAKVELLARLSRQSGRNVRRLLRKMESTGWLVRESGHAGGRGVSPRYFIDPDWVRLPIGWRGKKGGQARGEVSGFSDEKGGQKADNLSGFSSKGGHQDVRVSDQKGGQKADNLSGFCESTQSILNNIPPIIPHDPITNAANDASGPDDNQLVETPQAEIRKLADWMLARIRKINPKFPEPSWRSWERDIRRMVERDGHTLQDIAKLFAWANADEFWQVNILSPGKLRKQWGTLDTRRCTQPGKQPATTALTPDWRCVHTHNGVRCNKPGMFNHGSGKVCAACYHELATREAA